jgi:hypothetical protein
MSVDGAEEGRRGVFSSLTSTYGKVEGILRREYQVAMCSLFRTFALKKLVF